VPVKTSEAWALRILDHCACPVARDVCVVAGHAPNGATVHQRGDEIEPVNGEVVENQMRRGFNTVPFTQL
jgi:hypothetical protein